MIQGMTPDIHIHKTNQSGHFFHQYQDLNMIMGSRRRSLHCVMLSQIIISSVCCIGAPYNTPYTPHELCSILWPCKSRDLIAIENVQAQVTIFILKQDFRSKSQKELHQSINQVWDQMTLEYTRSLVLSIPQSLQAVIESDEAFNNQTQKMPFIFQNISLNTFQFT